MAEDDGFSPALALFRPLEHEPMDDEHNNLAGDIVHEYGTELRLPGMALVAAVIRQRLREHANGCDCGSDAWLEKLTFEHGADG